MKLMTKEECIEVLQKKLGCDQETNCVAFTEGCIACRYQHDDLDLKEAIMYTLCHFNASTTKENKIKPGTEKSPKPIGNLLVRFVDKYKCGVCGERIHKDYVCCPYCTSLIDWESKDD